MKKTESLVSYIFILPAFLLVVVLLLLPMLQNIYYSFFDWDGLGTPIFSALGNYQQFFLDPNFGISFRNTLIWVGFTLLVPVMGGLLISVFIRNLRAENIFKSVFFVPYTISFVATGLLWTYMFSKDLGILNRLLGLVGVKTGPSWLTGVPLNTLSILIAWTWQQLGLNMVLFLMGLTSVPVEPVEAASIEGATKWQTFIHVIFPMLRSTNTVVITMATVNSFKTFDIIYVMTRGGPYRSSETLAVTMFRETFTMSKMGYGSAISVFLSIIVIAVSVIYIRRMSSREAMYY